MKLMDKTPAKKDFVPFDITFRVESIEEVRTLYAIALSSDLTTEPLKPLPDGRLAGGLCEELFTGESYSELKEFLLSKI